MVARVLRTREQGRETPCREMGYLLEAPRSRAATE